MKLAPIGISLALVAAGLSALPALSAQAAAPTAAAAPDERAVVQRMDAEATNGIRVKNDRATGEVGFVRAVGRGDLLPAESATSGATAAAKATTYLDTYAAAFGAQADELTQSGVTATTHGWTVRYDQSYRGVPVFGARLLANLDPSGDLTSVNGFVAPALDLSVTPRVTGSEAAASAVSMVRAVPPGDDGGAEVSGLRAASTTLSVYRMGAIKGEEGANILAWVVEVTNRKNVRDMVFLDARTGKVVNRYSMIADALDREVYEADGGTVQDDFELVWSEGDAFPGDLAGAQQDLVQGSGDAYWLFQNTFGVDAYDGEGSTMRTVNNDGRINCPNANWNGVTTNYCDGVTSDDTVAHEWAHAYTEYTSGLIYQWQPGAMNEAFSDIWGETVDQVNDRYNETPHSARTEGQCSTFSPAVPDVQVNSPASIAGPCEFVGAATYGPQLDSTGLTGAVVVGTDAVEPEVPDEGLPAGTATDGCSPLDNAAEAAGKIVMVDRGLCPFVQKSENAADAGAIAVIIGNREDVTVSPADVSDIDIPTVTIGLTSREEIRTALAGGETVDVTMKDSAGERDDSYRWLLGESDPAFDGAIRDMWTPTCHGDAGKVSDAEYHCTADDSGGVHSNSGVVNHTFALLVDGSTSNGVEVAGIGLDKAANVFWRAQSAYLTPTSDFSDLADGLTQGCTDLLGQEINAVSVEEDTTAPAEAITADDCAAVLAATRATELTAAPTQCDFQPMLKKNAPGLCGKKFKTKNVWKDDFEKGLGKWKRSSVVVYDGGHGYQWKAVSNVPGDHGSKVAFDSAPDEGDCSGAAGDISSANGIISPQVKLPKKGKLKLSFQHYMATEPGYDGGNVKISVNGKGFQVIDPSAYVYNAPATTIASAAEENTNPLAGESGFTGTDGGVAFGSWGTSIVDLKKAGAKPGKKVRIKFELGRDGCGGNDGWYVDNVKVTTCKKKGRRQR